LNYREDVAIIIPSYDPGQTLIDLVQHLAEVFTHILIVDDGSKANTQHFFDEANVFPQVTLLRHMVNQGKGRAIKTAYNYILAHPAYAQGAVTVDSDGQHTLDDTVKVAQALLAAPENLVLGVRNFREAGIPFRSRFGNVLTSKLFKVLCGVDVEDTQTGLRGVSRTLMPLLMAVKGERFEYEMNVLLQTYEQHIQITQVPISTIYIDSNASSHFNPLLDSLRIYSMFLRFVAASASSFVIDIVLFSIFSSIFKPLWPVLYITIATIVARVFSASYNYTINRKKVFAGKVTKSSIAKYFALSVIQMLLSSWLVTAGVHRLDWNPTGAKIIVDTLLFFISFWVQREFVFNSQKRHTS
jgi:glycosyltransferase involved in cell wall biosynthesis